VDFGSQRRLAELLGVSPAQVSRWLRGQGIDPLNADKIDVLELVMASLLRLYAPEVARQWLLGLNPHLGNRRPIDLVRMGRVEELLAAVRAERAESYA
jgi:transcriptional regulator with XRE-family HTH domain